MSEPGSESRQPAVQDFGKLGTDARGIQYVQLADGLRVRVDACRPFRGTVETFEPNPSSAWHEVKLKDNEQEFSVHHNHIAKYGELSSGAEVEGLIDLVTGDRFWLLRRVPKKLDEMEMDL